MLIQVFCVSHTIISRNHIYISIIRFSFRAYSSQKHSHAYKHITCAQIINKLLYTIYINYFTSKFIYIHKIINIIYDYTWTKQHDMEKGLNVLQKQTIAY